MEIISRDEDEVEWAIKVLINAGHESGFPVYAGKTQRRLGMFIKKVEFRKDLIKGDDKE